MEIIVHHGINNQLLKKLFYLKQFSSFPSCDLFLFVYFWIPPLCLLLTWRSVNGLDILVSSKDTCNNCDVPIRIYTYPNFFSKIIITDAQIPNNKFTFGSLNGWHKFFNLFNMSFHKFFFFPYISNNSWHFYRHRLFIQNQMPFGARSSLSQYQ